MAAHGVARTTVRQPISARLLDMSSRLLRGAGQETCQLAPVLTEGDTIFNIQTHYERNVSEDVITAPHMCVYLPIRCPCQ